MTKKNDGNGYTIKEMISRVMDNQEKLSDKVSTQFQRAHEKMDEIVKYNAGQDKIIATNTAGVKDNGKQLGKIWAGIGATALLAMTSVVDWLTRK